VLFFPSDVEFTFRNAPVDVTHFSLLLHKHLISRSDLNEPFSGVYQVRRSTAATHMLEAKWLLANHPNTRGKIDYERADDDESDSVLVRTPGIGEFWFEKDDLYVDGQDFESIA